MKMTFALCETRASNSVKFVVPVGPLLFRTAGHNAYRTAELTKNATGVEISNETKANLNSHGEICSSIPIETMTGIVPDERKERVRRRM